jgi:hypothetical protein
MEFDVRITLELVIRGIFNYFSKNSIFEYIQRKEENSNFYDKKERV